MEQRVDFTYLRLITWAKAISLVAVSIGVSGVLISYGVSLVWHYVPPELRIANPEIRLVPPDPLTVVQKEPFTVTQDKSFTIAPPDPLKLDVGSLPRLPQEPQKTAGGEVIHREVTVFSNVQHNPGVVVSGWKFKDGSGREPLSQYCYYDTPASDGTTHTIYLAEDTVRRQYIAAGVPDLEGAIAKCQWWRG
jgi:hypothetical protein